MKFGKMVKKIKIDKKEVIFRYPKIEDLDGLRNLHNSLVEEGAYIELQKKITKREQLEWFLERIRKIENQEGILLIVEKDREVKGYALLERFGLTEPAYHIGELSINLAKDIRGKGYGKKLFLITLREIKSVLKIKIIFIDITKPNKSAFNFFTSLGFKLVGEIKRGFKYHGRYFDDIILVNYI